jgi:hypothetical protein
MAVMPPTAATRVRSTLLALVLALLLPLPSAATPTPLYHPPGEYDPVLERRVELPTRTP